MAQNKQRMWGSGSMVAGCSTPLIFYDLLRLFHKQIGNSLTSGGILWFYETTFGSGPQLTAAQSGCLDWDRDWTPIEMRKLWQGIGAANGLFLWQSSSRQGVKSKWVLLTSRNDKWMGESFLLLSHHLVHYRQEVTTALRWRYMVEMEDIF